jgi:hypothetical protein
VFFVCLFIFITFDTRGLKAIFAFVVQGHCKDVMMLGYPSCTKLAVIICPQTISVCCAFSKFDP